MKFYDREAELKQLREHEEQSRQTATFIVMMGRRRVGKTSLLLKSLEGLPYAYLFIARNRHLGFERTYPQRNGH